MGSRLGMAAVVVALTCFTAAPVLAAPGAPDLQTAGNAGNAGNTGSGGNAGGNGNGNGNGTSTTSTTAPEEATSTTDAPDRSTSTTTPAAATTTTTTGDGSPTTARPTSTTLPPGSTSTTPPGDGSSTTTSLATSSTTVPPSSTTSTTTDRGAAAGAGDRDNRDPDDRVPSDFLVDLEPDRRPQPAAVQPQSGGVLGAMFDTWAWNSRGTDVGGGAVEFLLIDAVVRAIMSAGVLPPASAIVTLLVLMAVSRHRSNAGGIPSSR